MKSFNNLYVGKKSTERKLNVFQGYLKVLISSMKVHFVTMYGNTNIVAEGVKIFSDISYIVYFSSAFQSLYFLINNNNKSVVLQPRRAKTD